jgi:hypothetical protein
MSRVPSIPLPPRRSWLALAAVAALALPPARAHAEDAPDLLQEPFLISLGSYAIDADTRMRVDGEAGQQGTKVDWEKTFGGGGVTRFRVDGQWRFAERHKLRALWFNSDRSEQRTIDRDIDWGDETFPVGARVKGEIGYDIYELAYEYAFLKRETWELSASIGAYYANWEASLSATVTDPDTSTERRIRGDADLAAPLPVLGARFQWNLSHGLWLDVSGQWFAVSVNEYSGNLQNYRGALTWQPRKWLGLGIGYDWFSANGEVDSSDFRGDLNWTYQGPMLYYSVAF